MIKIDTSDSLNESVCALFRQSVTNAKDNRGQCAYMIKLTESEISEVIEMALSDHTSFAQINMLYGLSDSEVKQLMRQQLKTASYRAWRRRVRQFSDRRAHYK